jgi:arginyl-tRNA--protein-N-Asp/Glu arginylyltransferase
VRVPVRLFAPSRNLKRIAAHNRDLRLEISSAEPNGELYNLFLHYQRARHADGDMALMSSDDFTQMLQEGDADTRLYSLRDDAGTLLASVIVDPVSDGLSAVYSFYTPDAPKRSLGTQLILSLIEETRRENLPYVYLGYWIEASRKMAYKARFQPLQALTSQGWDWLED